MHRPIYYSHVHYLTFYFHKVGTVPWDGCRGVCPIITFNPLLAREWDIQSVYSCNFSLESLHFWFFINNWKSLHCPPYSHCSLWFMFSVRTESQCWGMLDFKPNFLSFIKDYQYQTADILPNKQKWRQMYYSTTHASVCGSVIPNLNGTEKGNDREVSINAALLHCVSSNKWVLRSTEL